MSVERRPVHHGVAGSAVPGGVSAAAVTETSHVADEDLVGAEGVPVGASAGCFSHPLAAAPNEIALHPCGVIRHRRQVRRSAE